MEILKAKNDLKDLITSYATKIGDTGVKCVADVYFTDKKGLSTYEDSNEYSDCLCGSITVCAEDAKDENDKCGFDIMLQLTKSGDIKDSEFETSLSEFKEDIDVFFNELSAAEDKNEFIKQQSEKEKTFYAEKMEKFNKDIKKLQTVSLCILGVVLIIVFVGIFALISSL